MDGSIDKFRLILAVAVFSLIIFAIYTHRSAENGESPIEVQACEGRYKMSQAVYDIMKESEMRQWLEIPFDTRDNLIILMIHDTNLVEESELCSFPMHELRRCMIDQAWTGNPNATYTFAAEWCAEALKTVLETD